VSSDPKVKPVHEGMPLVRLLEGQDLELVAYGELGFGKDHMKWSPCLVTYKYYPAITITKQPRNAKRVADRYPALFEVKGDKLVTTKDAGAHMPDLDLDLDDGEITIVNSDDFLFTIESWGQLSAEQIVEEAIKRYDEKLEVFANSL
jgi:DNA-directed RNA polymerase subunit D